MSRIMPTNNLACALAFAPEVPLSIEERQCIFKSHEAMRAELALFDEAYRELLARWAKLKTKSDEIASGDIDLIWSRPDSELDHALKECAGER